MMRHHRYQIESIEQSCADTLTFNLTDGRYSIPEPGQFYMVWLPGVSENPISASGRRSITIRDLGEHDEKNHEKLKFSHAMMNLYAGDYVLMRGPLGRGFTVPEYTGSDICIIGGGCGTPPLRHLVSEAQKDKHVLQRGITGIIGARTADQLLFADEMGTMMDELVLCTDDGTGGEHGFVTKFLDKLSLSSDTYVYICGPEVMMTEAARQLVSNGMEPDRIQILVERYMKCGDGICGACDCGGKRVCKDGPAFTYEKLLENPDFGKYTRDASGKRVPLKKTQT